MKPAKSRSSPIRKYMKNGIQKWIANWKRNGWRTAEKKPVLNQDLWEELDRQNARHKTVWSWTKGHASHADNNRCDELALRLRATRPAALRFTDRPRHRHRRNIVRPGHRLVRMRRGDLLIEVQPRPGGSGSSAKPSLDLQRAAVEQVLHPRGLLGAYS